VIVSLAELLVMPRKRIFALLLLALHFRQQHIHAMGIEFRADGRGDGNTSTWSGAEALQTTFQALGQPASALMPSSPRPGEDLVDKNTSSRRPFRPRPTASSVP